MKTDDFDDTDPLDLQIDAALRAERPSHVPHGFHARLRQRIHIAVLLEEERRVFRRRLVRVGGIGALAATVALVTGMYWDISESFLWDFPGLLGKIDYLTVATNRVWLVSGNPALLLSAGVVGVTVFIAGAFVGLFRVPIHR